MNIINTYALPVFDPDQEFNPEGSCRCVMAVLTKDHIDQYAVYIGNVLLPYDADHKDYENIRSRKATMIAFSGNKLTYEKSKFFFSGIPEDKYRQ